MIADREDMLDDAFTRQSVHCGIVSYRRMSFPIPVNHLSLPGILTISLSLHKPHLVASTDHESS